MQAANTCGIWARLFCACALIALATLSVLPLHASASDDQYGFQASYSQSAEVALLAKDDGFEFAWGSAEPKAWDTALLGVRVSGAGKAPWIEVTAGALHLVQHLDAEAEGLRWLNLTGLHGALKPGVKISMLTHEIAVEPGSVVLRLFDNRLDLRKPILILAPHPDDAEIAAFGLYASHPESVSIVTVTAGNSGDANYETAFGADLPGQYLFKGYLRAFDSVTVPWQGGVPPGRCFNLGYFDGRLAEMHETPRESLSEVHGPNRDVAVYRRANLNYLLPTGSRENSWMHLVQDLTVLVRKLKPSVIVMPDPRLDTHLDHQYTAVAVVEALREIKRPMTFLLYTNHAARDVYPFGPAHSVMSLPPWPGPELLVQRVFSLPVEVDLRRRKLFALESMHDLRLSPAEQSTCGAGGPPRLDYPRVDDADYFRRAVRSEETFLAFDREGMRAVVRDFLALRER